MISMAYAPARCLRAARCEPYFFSASNLPTFFSGMEVRREQGTRRVDRKHEVSNRCAREASRVGGGQRQLNERLDGAQHSRAHSQREAGTGVTLMGSWRDVIPVHHAADLF